MNITIDVRRKSVHPHDIFSDIYYITYFDVMEELIRKKKRIYL